MTATTSFQTTVGNLCARVKMLANFPVESGQFKKFRNISIRMTHSCDVSDYGWDGGTRNRFWIMCFYTDGSGKVSHTSATQLQDSHGARNLSIVTDCIVAYAQFTTYQGKDCTPVIHIHPDHISVLAGIWPEGNTAGEGMPLEARIDSIRERGFEKEADSLTKIFLK
jgi:hypothetical protein